MALPGLLIESLINGAIALIWILPLWPKQFDKLQGIDILLLAPITYIIGMYIDLLAFLLTKWPKTQLRKYIEKKYKMRTEKYSPGDTKKAQVEIFSKCPELAKELITRSSRDRIARGMIVNSVFMLVCYRTLPEWTELVLFLLSIAMWVTFEYSSHSLFISSYNHIKSK